MRGRISQALNDTQCTQTKLFTQDGEEALEERLGPPEFGHDEEHRLEDDQETVEDSPEYPSGLVGNGAIPKDACKSEYVKERDRGTYGM